VTFVTSDPHAWLRPLYARLRRDPAFALLSPSHQFQILVTIVAEESPSKAELMRQFNTTTQEALLGMAGIDVLTAARADT
jgi:hypothetical protein